MNASGLVVHWGMCVRRLAVECVCGGESEVGDLPLLLPPPHWRPGGVTGERWIVGYGVLILSSGRCGFFCDSLLF